jgi:hypothetical protein
MILAPLSLERQFHVRPARYTETGTHGCPFLIAGGQESEF